MTAPTVPSGDGITIDVERLHQIGAGASNDIADPEGETYLNNFFQALDSLHETIVRGSEDAVYGLNQLSVVFGRFLHQVESAAEFVGTLVVDAADAHAQFDAARGDQLTNLLNQVAANAATER